jgi:cation diffusion facilitator family transporter
LLLGGKQAKRKANAEHPFGYGRDRYVYGFLVALVLFTLGGLFALYEGFHKIADPHKVDSPLIALGVLVAAIALEGYSFRTAIHESREPKGDSTWFQFIRRAKIPELPVVLLEDFAALIGLAFALVGVSLAALLDQPIWDGIGTVAIGVLLISVAVILIIETKSLLLGESATPAVRSSIAKAMIGPGVLRVIHMRTMHLGPDEVLVAAKIAISPTATAPEIASLIDAAEARIREAEPTARVIYLEPDLDREPAVVSHTP